MRNGLRVTGYFDGHGFTGVPATDAGTGSGPNEMEVSVYCPWHAVNSQLAVAFAALPQVQTACNAHNATLFLSPSLSIYLSHKHTLSHFLNTLVRGYFVLLPLGPPLYLYSTDPRRRIARYCYPV